MDWISRLRFSGIAIFLFACMNVQAQTQFYPGDLAVVGMNANNGQSGTSCTGASGEDLISIVLFRDVEPLSEIDLSDNGWQRENAGQWGNSEGTIRATWLGPGIIPAGTAITVVSNNSGSYFVSGPLAYTNWSFANLNPVGNALNLNWGGDQLYILSGGVWNQGTAGDHNATYSGRVIFGFNSKPVWVDFGGSSGDSGLHPEVDPCFHMEPTGATNFASYTGPMTAATQFVWRDRIGDPTNWSTFANCDFFIPPPDFYPILPNDISMVCNPCSSCGPFDVDLMLTFPDSGPWNVVISDGTNEFNFTSNSTSYTYSYPNNPVTGDISFDIVQVSGPDGCPLFSNFDVNADVTFSPGGDASWTNPGPLCNTEDPILLNTFLEGDLGGIFTGNFISFNAPDEYYFDPSAAGEGNHDITYTITLPGCPAVDSLLTITVQDQPIVPNTIDIEECPSGENGGSPEASFTPSFYNDQVNSSGGIVIFWYSDIDTMNLLDPDAAILTTGTTIYAAAQLGACRSDVVEVNLIPLALADPSWTQPAAICVNGGTITLNDYINGTTGGTFSGSGVIDQGGGIYIFDPAQTGIGFHDVTYSVSIGSCPAEFETHQITVLTIPNIATGLSFEECGTDVIGGFPSAAFDLMAIEEFINNNPFANFYFYTDPGLTIPIDPFNAFITTTTTIYVIVEIGDCASDATEITLTVLEPSDASWTVPTGLCETSTPVILTPDGTLDGIWSGDGITNLPDAQAEFDPAGLSGNIEITYTAGTGDCQDILTDFITINESHDLILDEIGEILCSGEPTGELTLDIIGGAPDFTIDWNDDLLDGLTNPTDLYSGYYSVTVTDFNNCVSEADITISEPSPIVLNCIEIFAVSGPGATDGEAMIELAGGVLSYEINWTGPTNGSTVVSNEGQHFIDNLPAGNYSVTISDGNNCQETCGFTINEANCNLAIDSLVGINPICFGDSNGNISLYYSGNDGIVSFDWNPDGSDGMQNPQDLSAGNYSVTIEDASGCQDNAVILLSEPELLTATCIVLADESSTGENDGIGQVVITGGTAPYFVSINAQGDQIISGSDSTYISLSPGAYSIIVTDANNCTTDCGFTIQSASCALEIDSLVGTNPACYADTSGSIAVFYSGQTGTVNFDWNVDLLDGVSDPSNIPAGNYILTLTDDAGCESIDSILLINPDSLILQCSTISHESDIGANDGVGQIEITGGTGPFSISFNGGSSVPISGADSIFSNLGAGSYSVIVSDANNCIDSCSFLINAGNCDIIANLNLLDSIDCNGDTSALVILSVNGGSSMYNYDWNVDAFDGFVPTFFPAGYFSLTLTDVNNNCTDTVDVLIPEPPALIIDCEVTTEISGAGANDGIADIEITGGSYPIQIDWQNISTGQNGSYSLTMPGSSSITNLQPGNYLISATDAKGCEINCDFSLNDGGCSIETEIVLIDEILCYDDSTGSIQVVVTNALAPIIIDWNIDILDGSQNPNNLPAGTYHVTVTDAADCISTSSFTLTEPNEIVIDCSTTWGITTEGAEDGKADIMLSGGTGDFDFTLTGPSNQNFISSSGIVNLNSLPPGDYTIQIVDENNCEAECNFTIDGIVCLLSTQISSFSDESCVGASDGELSIEITDYSGSLSIEWNDSNNNGENVLTNLNAGTYGVTVTDEQGCKDSISTDLIVLYENYLFTVTPQSTSCPGVADGSLFIEASGSLPNPVNLLLNNNQSFQIDQFPYLIENLGSDDYELNFILSDACEETFTTTIAEGEGIEINLGPDVTISPGESYNLQAEILGNLDSISWIPVPDNTCPACLSFSLVPETSQLFSAIVYNQNGCFDSDDIKIDVKYDYGIFVPNLFTPNNDGVNDAFFIQSSTPAKVITLDIFDRWGERVFQQQNVDAGQSSSGWNGMFKGHKNPNGVYIYHAILEFPDGKRETIYGEVSLLR